MMARLLRAAFDKFSARAKNCIHQSSDLLDLHSIFFILVKAGQDGFDNH